MKVGTSGRAGERFVDATPSARTLPALMCGSAVLALTELNCTSPASSAVVAGAGALWFLYLGAGLLVRPREVLPDGQGLEGSAARFAARHANEAEIHILYRLQRELAESDGDALRLVKMNRRFHQAIHEAAHNQYLLETLDTLNDSMALLHSTTFRAPSRRAESDEEHRRIVEAIEKHDPDTAEKIARRIPVGL